MAVTNWTTIKIENDTLEKLKNINIEMWWVKIKSYDDKINHLMWYYSSHKTNNESID